MKAYYRKRSLESRFINKCILLIGPKALYQSEEKSKQSLEKLAKSRKPYLMPNKYMKKVEINFFHGMKLYIFQGKLGSTAKKVILYMHGGAYVNELYTFHLRMLDKFVKGQEMTIIIPAYPLAPENTYHKTYELITELYQEILKTSEPKDITFMGDSAGGGFILAFAEYIKEINLPQPDNIIMISPWLDISMANQNIVKFEKKDTMLSTKGLILCGRAWAGELDVKDYRVSPINGDLRDLGHITIFTGTNEILNPDCHLLDERLDELAIAHNFYEYFGQGHDFPIYPIKETKLVIKQMLDVIYSMENKPK